MKKRNPKKTGGKENKKAKSGKVADLVVPGQDPKNEGEREVRLKETYVAFIRWTILTAAEKKKEKAPRTQGEFAKKHNVSEWTLSEWKDRGDYEKLRAEMFKKKLAAEVPEVMADLRKRIKKYGMGMDVELWLAYSEGWDRRRVLEIKPPLTLGDNDIRTIISKLPADKQKEFYDNITRLLAAARAADDDL